MKVHLTFGGRQAIFFLTMVALVSLVGCSGIISIERISTPTPLPSPTPSPPTAEPLPEVLRTGTGVPVRIVAETIDLDAVIVEMGWTVEERRGEAVSAWQVPDNEAAWHQNSAWPGQGGNVVISGHNASLGGQVFAEVEALETGDRITIWNGQGQQFAYQVRERTIVRTFVASPETQAFLRASIEPTVEERLTLITCWPRWTNTHRLVVVAEPVNS